MPTQTQPHKQPVEAFLLIEQPRQRLGHWINALAALDSPYAPAIAGVIAYYDPSCDQALVDLQYDPDALDDTGLQYVVNVALLAEVGMVQPAVLSEGERARFLSARLSRCTIRMMSQRTAVGALTELVRRIKDERAPAKPPPIPAAALARTVAPRGDTSDPPMTITAKGTRDNLEKLAKEAAPEMERAGERAGPNMEPAGDQWQAGPGRAADEVSSATSRNVVMRTNRYATTQMAPEVVCRLATASRDDDDPEDRITSPMAVAALQALSAETKPPDTIYARYLRGGRWVSVRVGALSLKGAALLTGALPRLHDRVDIALTFGLHRAVVRGLVAKVSTARESSASGAATFTVSFELDDSARKQLTDLLTAARHAKITIKPPPPRATRRFPVEWQLALGTTRGAIKATALDVSTRGMFVRPKAPLELDSTINFSVALDDGVAPVSGRARVVRRITEAEATTCGLAAGFGLVIVDMVEADRMRWIGFLARIERRAEKRVLIGAEPARLAELQAGLASLGYAVVGGTDAGTLVQLANADKRPADAVLIDSGWLQNEASTTLVESLFSARNVPCVTMNGEVRRARQTLDRLLDVLV